MAKWYGTPSRELTEEETEVPAGLLWLIQGDSVQRTAAAWHLGWKDAQAALPPGWGAPWLAGSLDDPYASVRYLSAKSLRRHAGFEDFEYDYLEDEFRQRIAVQTAKTLVSQDWAKAAEQQELFDRLRASRNNKPILFLE